MALRSLFAAALAFIELGLIEGHPNLERVGRLSTRMKGHQQGFHMLRRHYLGGEAT